MQLQACVGHFAMGKYDAKDMQAIHLWFVERLGPEIIRLLDSYLQWGVEDEMLAAVLE